MLLLDFPWFQVMAYLETRRVFWSDGAGQATSPARRVLWRTPAEVGDRHAPMEASSATSSVADPFFDSHCHLVLLFERDGVAGTLTEYMRRARVGFPADFGGCLTVFCRPNHWSRTSRWMNLLEDSRVYGAFGCHPHRATKWSGHEEAVLVEILRSHPRVVAVGEMGLDFSRNNRVPSDVQRKAFQRQLQIAINEELPVVLHLREAEREGLDMMQRMVPRGHPIHWHCVTGQAVAPDKNVPGAVQQQLLWVHPARLQRQRLQCQNGRQGAAPEQNPDRVRCPLLPAPGTARPDKMVPPWDGRACNRRSRRST